VSIKVNEAHTIKTNATGKNTFKFSSVLQEQSLKGVKVPKEEVTQLQVGIDKAKWVASNR
jgi:hypothetical protein